MPKQNLLPVAFDYPYYIDKFTALTLSKVRFPSTIYPGDPLDELDDMLLILHVAGIVDDDGYTSKFRSFKITVYDVTVVGEQIVQTKLAEIRSGTLPETGEILPIIYNSVVGIDGTRLYFDDPYGQGPEESDYRAHYIVNGWGPGDTLPSWITMPGRGEEPLGKLYRFKPEVKWDLYRKGTFKRSVTTTLNIYTGQKTYSDWEVMLMPPASYPAMIIDDANSYFPTQIEHDQPFDAQVKIAIRNAIPDAKGNSYLDLVYKGKRTPLMTAPIDGAAYIEYPLAGETIETLLGQTFTRTTFITSSELKFVAGYFDDAGGKQQTNEWLRGLNVVVPGANGGNGGNGGSEPQTPAEKSLLERIAVPVTIVSGVVATITGLTMLVRGRR
ncbi:MAG: hypothetical protein WC551_09655 [Patescibacteria group bacterium]